MVLGESSPLADRSRPWVKELEKTKAGQAYARSQILSEPGRGAPPRRIRRERKEGQGPRQRKTQGLRRCGGRAQTRTTEARVGAEIRLPAQNPAQLVIAAEPTPV
jgi:hypothetical protein